MDILKWGNEIIFDNIDNNINHIYLKKYNQNTFEIILRNDKFNDIFIVFNFETFSIMMKEWLQYYPEFHKFIKYLKLVLTEENIQFINN